LCSPPKTVFAFNPDSRATLRKLTPRLPAVGETSGAPVAQGGVRGTLRPFPANPATKDREAKAAKAKTFSSESTSAERLNDCRNVRREENKSMVPSRTGPHEA